MISIPSSKHIPFSECAILKHLENQPFKMADYIFKRTGDVKCQVPLVNFCNNCFTNQTAQLLELMHIIL